MFRGVSRQAGTPRFFAQWEGLMRRATSLQTPPHPYAHAHPTATVAVNGIATGAWCARMVGTGGGIFAYGE